MSARQTANRSVVTIAVIGSLVLLNFLGLGIFKRLDLTRDREFTLSSATVSTLQSLSDPLTVRAYFSKDLPPPFGAHARYVRDLLEEYYAHSNGQLRYEFIDPTSEETSEDKEKRKDVKRDIFGRQVREQTSVERDLETLGITPVQVRVNEGDKLEVKRAYMGIAVGYEGKNEVIPVVQETAGLEYDLTTSIRKLTRAKRPKVALLTGHDSPDLRKEIGRAYGVLGQLYDVTTIDLSQKAEIPSDVDAILVVSPKKPYSEAEQKAIDGFLVHGGSAAFLLDTVVPKFDEMKTEEADSGLGKTLESYGFTIEPGLVLDTECATISVARQQGPFRVQQPVHYPFLPEPKGLDADHPLTRGLSRVVFPFMSPLEVKAPPGVHLDSAVLVQSSAESWVHTPPYDLNPFRNWTKEDAGQQRQHPLVVAAEGALPSHFGQTAEGEAKPARVIVAGGASFIKDEFFAEGNQALFLNMLDWLVRDDALLAVRTRGLSAAPLGEVSDSARAAIRYANTLGVPLLCIAFGLIRWRRREGRRSRVSL
jgi:gliding motility-associatede transport system auxiliary component